MDEVATGVVDDAAAPNAASATRPAYQYTPRPFTARRGADAKKELRRDAIAHAARKAASRVQVAGTLVTPHPRVAATRAALVACVPGELDLLESADPAGLRVRVTRPLVDRAMLILDALVGEIERRGWTIAMDVDPVPRNVVTVGGEAVGLSLYEVVTSKPHVPNRRELRLKREDPVFFRLPRRDHAAAGRLYLGVSPCHHGRGHWSDTSRWAVEDCLDLCLDAIVGTAEQLPKLRAEAELLEQKRGEAEATRLEAEQRRREEDRRRREAEEVEQRRRTLLGGLLERMHRADEAREYARRLEDAARRSGGGDATAAASVAAWIDWVRGYADRLDPCGLDQAPEARW